MGSQRLPFQPLEDWVDVNRGGLNEVLRRPGVSASGEAARSDRGTGLDYAPMPSHPQSVTLLRMWLKCRARGWVTEKWADEFCVRVLRINPALIWGEEWWRLDDVA